MKEVEQRERESTDKEPLAVLCSRMPVGVLSTVQA